MKSARGELSFPELQVNRGPDTSHSERRCVCKLRYSLSSEKNVINERLGDLLCWLHILYGGLSTPFGNAVFLTDYNIMVLYHGMST